MRLHHSMSAKAPTHLGNYGQFKSLNYKCIRVLKRRLHKHLLKTTRLRHYFFDINKKLKVILEQGFPTGEQRCEFECKY